MSEDAKEDSANENLSLTEEEKEISTLEIKSTTDKEDTDTMEKDPLADLSEEDKVDVIKSAVKDIDMLDILVCGKCHNVYHFVEEFNEHKSNGTECEENNDLREGLKGPPKKAQQWAFCLWKNTQFKSMKDDEKGTSSWEIYQTWRTLDPNQKKIWIKASESAQELCEVVNTFERAKLKLEKEHVEDENDDKKEAKQPTILNSKIPSNTRKAKRTGSDQTLDFSVEKIISKRYNPRRKCYEYLIKWENMGAEKNTWEAATTLINCKKLLEDFDKKFQLQREQIRLQKSVEKKASLTKKVEIIQTHGGGRPQRTSKQKALNQVKAWCGNMEADDGSSKRVFSDDSEDDELFEKRLRLDEESSDSENDKPTSSKVVKSYSRTQNGVDPMKKTTTTTTITLPENILIPDSKGIVRISQKQIPSLSSGVYVMSKTAGIIKLDADAAKLTAGGGPRILKVAQKVGQPTVKIIKKDLSNGGAGSANKTPTAVKTTTLVNKPGVKNFTTTTSSTGHKVFVQKKPGPAATANVQGKPEGGIKKENKEEEAEEEEEESDGMEDMDFPEDIQLPAADSPPPEFTLCPWTGKVMDKDGNFLDSKDAPRSETTATDKAPKKAVNNKLGAILDDLGIQEKEDVKVEPKPKAAATSISSSVSLTPIVMVSSTPKVSMAVGQQQQQRTVQRTIISAGSPRVVQQVIQKPKTQQQQTNSILSSALTNANIVRRGPPKLVPRSSPRPTLITTQMRAATPTVQRIFTKISPGGAMTPRTRVIQQQRPATQIVRKRVVQQASPQVSPASRVGGIVKKLPLTSPLRPNSAYVVTSSTAATKTVSSQGVPPLVEKSQPVATKTTTPTTTVQAAEKSAAASTSAPTSTVTTSSNSSAPPVISLTDTETPLLITGEDGTIYQVAGQNEEGQTILITQGEDGEQQCLLVAPENAALINQAIMKPASVQQVQQQQQEPETKVAAAPQIVATTGDQQEEVADESQVVAQIVSANPPSPGGTRKVVLMLPDGNYMMTEVTADQYAALELDK